VPDASVDMIPQAIADTNRAFANSGLDPRVNLVGTTAVEYEQTDDMAEDLGRLWNPDDGAMDEVHSLRDELGADLVALIVPEHTQDACGVGYEAPAAGEPSWGFSAMAANCFAGYTFVHELGHNLGANHNVEDVGENGCEPFPHSCGHWITGVGRDLMSYEQTCPDCPSRLQFSNPDVSFLGHPDVPSGTPDRDNARSVGTVAAHVANYR
jgi:hypothetical protein